MGELNTLLVWGTDIGNAYLEAFTEELLYIIAGPEFGELEGHVLIVLKALYGLRSSGLRWWERFSAVLRLMGFVPSKAEDDIWMRKKNDHYEYIARYVDDLAIVSKEPESIIKELEKVHAVCARQVHNAPHETLLVLDATTGQNAISQAKHFKDAVQITGIILTKLDSTAKGGIVFAIEEMGRSFEEKSNGVMLTAVILAGIISLMVLGNYNYFGSTTAVRNCGRAFLSAEATARPPAPPPMINTSKWGLSAIGCSSVCWRVGRFVL